MYQIIGLSINRQTTVEGQVILSYTIKEHINKNVVYSLINFNWFQNRIISGSIGHYYKGNICIILHGIDPHKSNDVILGYL